MSNIIGGTGDYHVVGTNGNNNIFGAPYTAGNTLDVTVAGGVLARGRGGNDTLDGQAGDDNLFGDAWRMTGNAVGGNDTLYGGEGNDWIYGDAY